MLVGRGVDVGYWQGMSDSTGWHHQSSFVVRQGYNAPSLPQTPCYCTVIWPDACFPATVPKATVQVMKRGITLPFAPPDRLREAETVPLHPAGRLHTLR